MGFRGPFDTIGAADGVLSCGVGVQAVPFGRSVRVFVVRVCRNGCRVGVRVGKTSGCESAVFWVYSMDTETNTEEKSLARRLGSMTKACGLEANKIRLSAGAPSGGARLLAC